MSEWHFRSELSALWYIFGGVAALASGRLAVW